MAKSIYQFPAQKKTLAQKTDKWGKECIDAAITITTGDTSKIRKSKSAKKINYDLINGIINESDIENAFNPMGIKGANFPAKIQNYPIEVSKFNVLKGEEIKRRFDFRIRSVNEDAISQKETEMSQQIFMQIMSELQNPEYSEEMAARRLQQLEKYHNYDHQDFAEVMATRIVDYFWYTQKMKETFSEAFYDVLIAAEEVYSVNISHGEPVVEKENTLAVSVLGIGDSHKMEDSDMIIVDKYESTGKVIDEFWDDLSETEVDLLESGAKENSLHGDIVVMGPIDTAQESVDASTSQLISINSNDAWNYGGSYDEYGNIRVTRVVWKSRRKIGKLKYYGPNGNEYSTIVDENFPVDNFKHLGWEVEWKWINEWWQGYRIGKEMYKRIEPLPRIGTKMNNPSICLPPYVGTIYRIAGTGVSLMDRVKPYKYLYNVYMRRTELASARNKGVIAELDLAEIPDNWDENLVMMFAEANGYMVKDSFKEGKKGQATGKLIGTIKQRGSDVLNLNSADVIRANLELARYVKNELAEVAGITPQREGQVGTRETLGGVEHSIEKSSHITEEWFSMHDNTKIRVIELLIETAKHAWRYATGENAKKLQYVDDGLITHMFTVDGRKFHESEYGFYVSDGRSDAELISVIKTLAQAGLQNDKIKFKDIFTLYSNRSVSAMERLLEASEKEQDQKEQDAQREALASQEGIQEALQQIEMMKMEQTERIEMAKIESDLMQTEMEIQGMLAKTMLMEDGNSEKVKIEADMKKLEKQLAQKREEMKERSRQFYDGLKSQEKRTKMQNENALKIASKRPAAKAV